MNPELSESVKSLPTAEIQLLLPLFPQHLGVIYQLEDIASEASVVWIEEKCPPHLRKLFEYSNLKRSA